MPRCLYRYLAATAGALTLVFAASAAADSSLLLDQQQPVVFNGFTFAIGGGSQQMLAQTVTTGISGELAQVQLPVGCTTGDSLLVQIEGVSGAKPNGTVLASQLVASSELPPLTGSFSAIDFDKPVRLTAGASFAIVLSSTGSCGILPGPPGDSYQSGDLFFIALPNRLDEWVCNCEFAGASFDLPFKTLVGKSAAQELADLAEAVKDVGPGSSLTDKVAQAQAYLASDDLASACSTLAAFERQVAAQSGKRIAADEAEALSSSVKEITSTLAC